MRCRDLTTELQANKSRTHEVQAAKEELAAKFSEQAALVAKAEEHARGLEKKVREADEKVNNVWANLPPWYHAKRNA